MLTRPRRRRETRSEKGPYNTQPTAVIPRSALTPVGERRRCGPAVTGSEGGRPAFTRRHKALADDLAKGIKRERRGVQESGTGGGGGGRGRGAGAGGRGGGAGGGRGAQAPPEGDQER